VLANIQQNPGAVSPSGTVVFADWSARTERGRNAAASAIREMNFMNPPAEVFSYLNGLPSDNRQMKNPAGGFADSRLALDARQL
jgi:hypothetical protein